MYLTKNGEGDLVVMDIGAFARREKMLKLREELLSVEEDRLAGRAGTSPDELDSHLEGIIAEAEHVVDAQFVPVNKYHKMCVGKWYLILYQIKDQTAYVDYIVDCRQDCGWLVR